MHRGRTLYCSCWCLCCCKVGNASTVEISDRVLWTSAAPRTAPLCPRSASRAPLGISRAASTTTMLWSSGETPIHNCQPKAQSCDNSVHPVWRLAAPLSDHSVDRWLHPLSAARSRASRAGTPHTFLAVPFMGGLLMEKACFVVSDRVTQDADRERAIDMSRSFAPIATSCGRDFRSSSPLHRVSSAAASTNSAALRLAAAPLFAQRPGWPAALLAARWPKSQPNHGARCASERTAIIHERPTTRRGNNTNHGKNLTTATTQQ